MRFEKSINSTKITFGSLIDESRCFQKKYR